MQLSRPHLGFRRLLQALLALAVFLAPVTANAMQASAMVPVPHHETAKASAHCGETSGESSKHEKAADKTCCASMCMGVAVGGLSRVHNGSVPPVVLMSPVHRALTGAPAELATPPPRTA